MKLLKFKEKQNKAFEKIIGKAKKNNKMLRMFAYFVDKVMRQTNFRV